MASLYLLFLALSCACASFARGRKLLALLLVFCAVGAGTAAEAQSGNDGTSPVASLVPVIRSFAGGGSGGNNVAATASSLAAPAGTAIDSAGNVYIADEGRNTVRLVSAATGQIATVVGTGSAGYSGDGGLAVNARIYYPQGIALDPFGNLYISDTGNNVIRKVVLSTGIISTVAGTGTRGYSGDNGPATAAKLYQPCSVASDAAGNIWFSDAGNERIRMLGTNGIIKTVAGTGTAGFSGDGGSPLKAQLNDPLGVQLDPAGDLFIADYGNQRIRELNVTTGLLTTIAGNGTAGYSGDGGAATNAELDQPIEAFPDNQGNLYISDSANNRIRKITAASGVITTFAGTGTAGYAGDGGLATSAQLNKPVSIIQDSFGTLYIADLNNLRVRTISALPTTILFPQVAVGSAGVSQNIVMQLNTAATISSLAPRTSKSGKQEFTVSKVSGCTINGSTRNLAGSICTVVLNFTPGYPGIRAVPLQLLTSAGNVDFGLLGTGGGPEASLLPGTLRQVPVRQNAVRLSAIVIDNAGNAYLSSPADNEVLRIDASSGAMSVFAGNGVAAFQGDNGAAASASLNNPAGLTLDAAGALYIADEGNGRIRRVDGGTGVITTVAGGASSATGASTGDGGAATAAGLNSPSAVVLDTAGNLYIAENAGNRIRRVTATSNIITTYAGTGNSGFSGDGGPAASAQLNGPSALAIDGSGNLYVADSGNNCIRMVAGSSAYISTIAGGGSSGGDGGAATSAQLLNPTAVAVDSAADVYIAESGANRLRMVSAATHLISTVAGSGQAGPSSDGASATVTPLEVPSAVALDPAATLYVGNDLGLVRIDGSTATPLAFATTPAGGTSSDSPQSIALLNLGNTSLSFPVPSSGSNPAISTNFLYQSAAAGACPLKAAGQAAPSPLAAGASCLLPVSFSPTTTGALQGNLVVSDTSLNNAGSLQSLSMSGSGTTASVGLQLSAPSMATYGNAIQVTASMTDSATQSPVTGGTIAFADANGSFGSQAVKNGTAQASWLAPAAGAFTLNANFTPPNNNMSNASAQTTVQITAAPLLVSAANTNRTYGVGNPQFTGAITGAVNNDSFVESFQTSAGAASPIGSYNIVPSASGANLASYLQKVQNGTLQISPAALTLSANDATRSYGAANPIFTGAVSGAVNNDQLTETFSTTATSNSPVASYPITPAVSGAAAGNYNPTIKTGSLTITQAGLSVAANDATRAYGAANPTFTGSITGAVNNDQLTETFTTTATGTSPVASYPITPAVSGAALANYNPTIKPGSLTVTQAGLSVAANDATRTYGAANPTFTGTLNGTVNGDQLTETFSTTATSSSPVASYPITPAVSGAAAANYNPTIKPGSLTVTQAGLFVAANDATRAYGAANPTFTGTLNGAVNGDQLAETFTTTATASSPVANYPITPAVSGAAAVNYNTTVKVGSLTITQANLSIAANDATRTYGAANPTFTGSVSGAVNNDQLSETFTTTATSNSPVASYPITPAVSGAAAANYNPTIKAGSLTITAANLSIAANDATRQYGAANPTFTGSLTGAVNNDQLAETFTTTATANSPVASYAITPAISGAAAANYNPTIKAGSLTITQANLSVAANDTTRQYGAANPTFTGTISGAVNGDQLTETFSTTATSNSPVASYPITPAVSGAAAANYNPTIKPGSLTITEASLSLSADNLTRVYGAANPTLTGTMSGAMIGDQLTESFTTDATIASPAGEYPITPAVSGAAAANYKPAIKPGVLTITKANLALAANDQTRRYGAANPTFSGTVTGAVNGDQFAEAFSTSATQTSPVASYPIVPSVSGANLSNYSQAATNGTLTITGAPLNVSANSVSRGYGMPDPEFTGSVTGILEGDTLQESFSTDATQASAPGVYSITPAVTGAALGNYTPSTAKGVLTITAAPLTVSAQDAVRPYGSPNPQFAGTVSGAVQGEAFTETFTTSATAQSPVGVYPITPAAAGPTAANYTPSVQTGRLTVTPAALAVTAAPATRFYGAPNPVLIGTISGVANGDILTATYATAAGVGDAPGQYPIIPTVTGSGLANYTLTASNSMLTIQKAGCTTTLTQQTGSAGATLLQAQVAASTSGTPGGIVQFFAGKVLLGESQLQAGTANLSTTQLTPGTSAAVSAVYQGDANFLPSLSDALSIQVPSMGFWVSPMSSMAAVSVKAGGTANFPLQVGPGTGGMYPGQVTFSVAGLPTGASATFSPATLAANSTVQSILMTVQLSAAAAPAATQQASSRGHLLSALERASLALMLLPLAGARRLRRAGRGFGLSLLLILGSLLAGTSLMGCGFSPGSFQAQAPTSYTLTVTMESAGIKHTTTTNLLVEQQQSEGGASAQ